MNWSKSEEPPILQPWSTAFPPAANIRFHSKIIHEKALLRNLIHIATEIVTMGYENTERVENLLDFAEQSIFGISERESPSLLCSC